MSDVTRVYFVEAWGRAFDSMEPIQAVFADAFAAIQWARAEHPDTEVRQLRAEDVDAGLVYRAEANMKLIQVRTRSVG